MEFGVASLWYLLPVVYLILLYFSIRVQFWSKWFLITVYCVLFIPTLFIPFALLRPKNVINYNFIMLALRFLSKMVGIKWNIQGLEHVKRDEPAVITLNHQSELDIIGLGMLWPSLGLTTTVMKRELLFAGPFGLASYLCDSMYVDRSNPKRARQTVDSANNYLAVKKIKICIFPEGTTNESGTMLPFKKGAFHMAVKSQVPILPVVISSYSSFYNSEVEKFDHGGQLNVQILPPVPTAGLTTDDIDQLVTSVRQSMQETFESISSKEPESNGISKK